MSQVGSITVYKRSDFNDLIRREFIPYLRRMDGALFIDKYFKEMFTEWKAFSTNELNVELEEEEDLGTYEGEDYRTMLN